MGRAVNSPGEALQSVPTGQTQTDLLIDVDTIALDGLVLRPDLSGDPSLRAGTTGDLTADVCATAIAALLRHRPAAASP